MKKWLSILLAAVLVLSLVACGKKGNKGAEMDADGAWYVGSEAGAKKLKTVGSPLDAEAVYNSVDPDPRMLYGRFMLNDLEKDGKAYGEKATYAELTYSETYSMYSAEENLTTAKLSTLPVTLDAGPSCCDYARKLRGEQEWAVLGLLDESGNVIEVLCTYEVNGNQVKFLPLDAYEEESDEEFKTTKIRYTVGEDGLEYTYQIKGTSLILSNADQSLELKTYYFSKNNTGSVNFGGYLASESAAFDDVDYFSFSKSKDLNSVYITDRNGELYSDSLHNAAARLTEEGLLSIYWETKDEEDNVTEHIHHFAYYPGGGFSCMLTDGNVIYDYSESYLSRETAALGEGMSQEDWDKLRGLSDNQIQEIAKKKADLLADLAQAYKDAGLAVSINTVTGEIALDATVLFEVSEYEISADGKDFLKKFTEIYTSVVYSEAYADFVSKVLIEGHTDTSGSYEMNLELSQNRAESVKNYCASPECGLDASYAETFLASLEAVGYSFDKPVYDAEGNVDMAASRRVSFRFLINLNTAE